MRLDGLPALELWYLIVSVFGHVSRVSDRSGQPDNDVRKRHESQKKIDVVEDIDSIPSNVQSANREALLYVFEDNEAVIEMIIKGRRPTMRHVSRTHRVALDWLFNRIYLDPKIQIKYVDIKNQFADICDWNHLLCLFFLSLFSSTVCSDTMAKRTSHSKIATDDESCCQDAISRIVFNLSKPGEEILRKSRSMEFYCSRGQIGAT